MSDIEKVREYIHQLLDEEECVLKVDITGRVYVMNHHTLETATIRDY